jgi:hypothetical protein
MAKQDLRRKTKHTEYLMRNLAIGFVLGQNDNKCVIINYRTFKIVPVTMELYKSLEQLPFHYLMHYGVFGIKGKSFERGYMEYKVERIGTRCTQGELAPLFNKRHAEMIKEFNKERFTTAGWFTTIVDVDLTEDHVAKVFEALGAWNVIVKNINTESGSNIEPTETNVTVTGSNQQSS